ncbi:uncharacterized protein LOC129569308 [Sitodiplosis mosellana]|uniref:uncharacterized protein LOC129569308 n=1 Tax=Sitodiplosis mosellana TaxID=263140 RepID=UPI002444ABEF|nr:uncharacterized protein LOC129569308 [Sitodiplosis mosellana]
MAQINGVFLKSFYLIILVIVFKYNDLRSAFNRSDFSLLNFEYIKNDLFTKGDFSALNDRECVTELETVANALMNSEEWALKLLDAWGKFPSGLFSGNFHDFGEFSQCFSIKRNGELYRSQYCLGHLSFDVEGWLQQKPNQHIKQILGAPDLLEVRNIRGAVPKFDGGPGFTFGVCVPAACSLNMLEPIINKLIHAKTKNVSISFNTNTCQLEESPSELSTLDTAAIVFLGIIFCLIATSTSYDILYTSKNREKSRVLLAFSFYTNGQKLLSYKESNSPNMLSCLHGIRVITTLWVVIGHTFLMFIMLPNQNLIAIPTFITKYHAMFIASAPVSVDTFFAISGILVSINMLKYLEKSKGKMNILRLYLHRYLRLTPLLAVTILLSMSLARFSGSGPLFPYMVGFFSEQCERNWWATLLYIQNYVYPDDMCLLHTWYLSVDMQLFFVAPFIVYMIYFFKSRALYVLSMLVIACVGGTIAIHEYYQFTALMKDGKLGLAYITTHVRFSSWLIGVIAGYFFVEARKKSVQIPKLVNLLAWAISLVSMLIVILANYPLMQLDSTASPLQFGLYDALSRVVWSIAICFIIFACVNNHGGVVNRFLSHPLLQPISRLSYSIYLLHIGVIMATASALNVPLYFSVSNAINVSISVYVITIFVSIIASLAFESPIVIIEKFIFGSINKPDTHTENEQQNQSEIPNEPKDNDTNSILNSPTISDDTEEVLAALNLPYRGLIIKILKKLKQSEMLNTEQGDAFGCHGPSEVVKDTSNCRAESDTANGQHENQQNQPEVQNEPTENDTNSILTPPTISDDTGEVLEALDSSMRLLYNNNRDKQMKMAKVQIEFSFLILFIISIKFNHAKLQTNESNLNFIEFEQMKSDLFLKSDFDILNLPDGYSLNELTQLLKCFKELAAIQKGLKNHEEWAMKILDSWGKIPSGILSGNFYEFGDFSQCLNIKRNGTLYKTQYCMGQLALNMDTSTLVPRSHMNNINVPNVWKTEDPTITPRMAIAPQSNGLGFKFGTCMPATCSLHLLEPIINDKILKNGSIISVKFPENTCQFEETASEFRTIDTVTIMLLAFVLCLVVASTCYDVMCTITNCTKSQALSAFSFFTNGLKLLSNKKTKSLDMMYCLHGIRAISTQWVVLGHTFLMYGMLPIRNTALIPEFMSRYHNMIILSAPIAVDTFFVLSGLLVSINMLKHLDKTQGRINISLLYFHRYLRLTPLLFISVLFSMSLLRFFGSGPLWSQLMNINTNCEKYWWSTLLYVQNYVNPNDICFGHSWYLSVDMQLFLISPVIIYLMYKLRMILMPILLALVLVCIGLTIFVHLHFDLTNMLTKMDKAYYPTHIRFSPWLIGVMAGFIFVEARKRPVRIPQIFNLFAWVLSLALMVAVIFVNYPLQQIGSKSVPLDYALYDSLSRVAWAIALIYVIFACVHGYGGPVDWFLGHPLWQPISRLCYSIYLLHFPVILITMGTMKAPPYFTELTAFHAFIGNYGLTVFVAIIGTLAFESPILIIEKLMFSTGKKPDNSNTNIEPNRLQNNTAESRSNVDT